MDDFEDQMERHVPFRAKLGRGCSRMRWKMAIFIIYPAQISERNMSRTAVECISMRRKSVDPYVGMDPANIGSARQNEL
jgi:hypothetical protein